MKPIIISAVLLLAVSHMGRGQADPGQPIKLTSFFNLTTTTTVDNRSPSTRSSNVHLFRATGVGVFSVQLQFSDVASTGPWTNFPEATALVSNTSSSASGGAYGNHSFIRILITGSATVQYSGTKNLYIPLSGAGGIVNLATSVTGVLPYQNGGAQGAPYDIRYSGALCDGSDQNAAFQAALTAGFVYLFVPGGCMVIIPGGFIPANIIVKGENWITSVIKSAADPTTVGMTFGSGTRLIDLNLQGNTVETPTNCPMHEVVNVSDRTQKIISTCYSSFDSISGQDNFDRTGVFFKTGAFPTGASADAINVSNSPPPGFTGNALRADNYSGFAGANAILATAMPGVTGNSTAIIATQNFAGAGINPIHIQLIDSLRNNGTMFGIAHNTSSYNAGDMIVVNAAQGSGNFAGTASFLRFTNNNQTMFNIGNAGNVGITAGAGTAPLGFGTGDNREVIRIYDGGSLAGSAGFGHYTGEFRTYHPAGGVYTWYTAGVQRAKLTDAALNLADYTVAGLPACGITVLSGTRASVSDATQTITAGIGAVVAGGGVIHVPVYCDGSAWRIY